LLDQIIIRLFWGNHSCAALNGTSKTGSVCKSGEVTLEMHSFTQSTGTENIPGRLREFPYPLKNVSLEETWRKKTLIYLERHV